MTHGDALLDRRSHRALEIVRALRHAVFDPEFLGDRAVAPPAKAKAHDLWMQHADAEIAPPQRHAFAHQAPAQFVEERDSLEAARMCGEEPAYEIVALDRSGHGGPVLLNQDEEVVGGGLRRGSDRFRDGCAVVVHHSSGPVSVTPAYRDGCRFGMPLTLLASVSRRTRS